ncbi:MAG: cell division protein FtsQ/DivIB [Candidatus Limnocylindrales bacterium]
MISRGLQPRRSGSQVRRPPARRSGPPLRTVQLAGVILMAASLAGIAAVSVAPSFAAKTLEIHGDTFTSQAIVRTIIGIDRTPNVFGIQTDRAAEQLVRLPAVQSATVVVRLPSTVVVTLVERQPKLVWVIGDQRYVVDQDGFLFGLVDPAGNPIPSSVGPLPSSTPDAGPSASSAPAASSIAPATASPSPSPTPKPTVTPKPVRTPTPKPGKATPKPAKASATPSISPTPTINASLLPSLLPAPTADPAATSGPSAVGLPVVFDRRASDASLGLGGIVDPVNLDAGYRLAHLTPTDLGSTAPSLAVVLDDEHGFTLGSVPAGWVAEFGFYAPTIRKDTIIPNQVRDLSSALAYWGESKVAWVYLVSDVSSDHTDTVVLR